MIISRAADRPSDHAATFLAAAERFTAAASTLRPDPKRPVDPATLVARALAQAAEGVELIAPLASDDPNTPDAGRAIDAVTSARMGSQLLERNPDGSSTSKLFREVRALYTAAALACTD